MEELEKFIYKILDKKKEYTELELVRYVYIELGKIMSFDTNFFYGNERNMIDIYSKCHNDEESLNNYLENQIVICKSIAYLFKYILKKLEIRTEIIVDDNEQVLYKHVSNVIFMKNGDILYVDLQNDLENIQANLRTKYFGKNQIPNDLLEQIDIKIGYITEQWNYSEDYFYLLKKALNNNISFKEKISFILNNVNVYTDIKNMKYIERRSYYYHFIHTFITEKEKNKLHFIDCYQMGTGPKEYRLCIVVENHNDDIIYLYSNETQSFEELTLEELSMIVKKGLIILGNIPRLRKYINKQKTIQKELH